jgi:hypothetical protein
MNTVCSPVIQGNPLNPFTDRGVSTVAEQLQRRIIEIWENFFQETASGEPRTKALELLEQLLKECSDDNWDGYGAKAINLDSYCEAWRLLVTLPTTIPLPEITIEPDGEIAFEWDKGTRRTFSISIGSMNKITYAGIFGSNKAHGTEYF